MKVGDKVRFLNEVGGGVVKGFQDKNTVLVEDTDGFDIPVPVRECIVVDAGEGESERNAYSLRTSVRPSEKGNEKADAPHTEMDESSIKQRLNSNTSGLQIEENEPADRPVTYKADTAERRGGDKLNLYLCFLPVTVETLSRTEFDTYLVNDSNYALNLSYLSGEGAHWMARWHGMIEPNTKEFLETIDREQLNELAHVCLQATAFKEDKTFMLKPTINVELRLDLTKFYKLHLFSANDFFEERVLTFDVVRNDEPVRQIFPSAAEIKESLAGERRKKEEDDKRLHVHAVAIKKEQHDDIEVVDLHASELLETTRGMKPADILEYQLDTFRRKMEEYKNRKGSKIIFIHGKGQGVLRNAVLSELKRKYKNCTSQDASFREYGYGATMVIVH